MSVEREEAKEVFTAIIDYFPHFNTKGPIERRKNLADRWITQLTQGDFYLTMKKLDEYASDSSFPPALADFLVKLPKKQHVTNFSDDIRKVQEEKSNPETAKIREEKLKNLRAAMGGVFRD